MNKGQKTFCEIVSKDLVGDPRFTYVFNSLSKFTPVKPVLLDPDFNRHRYSCGTCGNPIGHFIQGRGLVDDGSYCEKCGTEIDWDSAEPYKEVWE